LSKDRFCGLLQIDLAAWVDALWKVPTSQILRQIKTPATHEGPLLLLAPLSNSPRLEKQSFHEHKRVCAHVLSSTTPAGPAEAVAAAYASLTHVGPKDAFIDEFVQLTVCAGAACCHGNSGPALLQLILEMHVHVSHHK
jgi:hypothetical protein